MFRKVVPVKILFLFIFLGVLLGYAIGMAAFAKATPASYLIRLENAGYYGPMATWLTIGRFVCAHEYNDQATAYAIVANTGANVYTEQAYEIMGIARDELCPSSGNGAYVV